MRHGQPGQLDGDLVGEADRRLLSGGRHPAGQLGDLAGQPLPLALQLVELLVGDVQIGQSGAGPFGPGDHPVDVVGVLAGQRAQRGPPLVDVLQPGRVGVQRRQVGRQLGGDVRDQRRRLLQPGGQLAQRRVGAGLPLQGASGGAEQCRGVRRLVGRLRPAGHALLGQLRRGAQPLGVLQPLRLGLELVVLAGLRVDPGDLVEAEPQQVGLLVALAGVAPPVGQVVDHLAPPGVRLAQRVEQLLVRRPGEPVQRSPLLGRAQQPQLVGLAVHGHHLLADLAEHRHRHAPAAQVRPGPALHRHRAAQQHRPVLVRLAAGVGDPGVHRVGHPAVQAQPPLHHRPAGLGAHPPGVGPAAEEQAEAGHHHRLARTGLAGDDVHAAGQRQRGVLDDAQSRDAQLFQHSHRQ